MSISLAVIHHIINMKTLFLNQCKHWELALIYLSFVSLFKIFQFSYILFWSFLSLLSYIHIFIYIWWKYIFIYTQWLQIFRIFFFIDKNLPPMYIFKIKSYVSITIKNKKKSLKWTCYVTFIDQIIMKSENLKNKLGFYCKVICWNLHALQRGRVAIFEMFWIFSNWINK